jgi:uracil-DNA glycosylase family 4
MSKGLYRTRAADPTRQGLVFSLESGADVLITDEKDIMQKTARKAESPQTAANASASAQTRDAPRSTNGWAAKARDAALAANSLEELKAAIAAFEGLEVKNTATNMVFSDGNPKARVMVIGEAPGADEDAQGLPFVGMSGRLLDKILASISLSRKEEDPNKALYISNVLNWRPPGNRTPTPQEMEIARPFIERHVALIQPDVLLFAGAVAVQTLLPGAPTLSKVRGRWLDYQPLTEGITLKKSVKAYALYHPAYLLRSPLQKKKAWHDMLAVHKQLNGV